MLASCQAADDSKVWVIDRGEKTADDDWKLFEILESLVPASCDSPFFLNIISENVARTASVSWVYHLIIPEALNYYSS